MQHVAGPIRLSHKEQGDSRFHLKVDLDHRLITKSRNLPINSDSFCGFLWILTNICRVWDVSRELWRVEATDGRLRPQPGPSRLQSRHLGSKIPRAKTFWTSKTGIKNHWKIHWPSKFIYVFQCFFFDIHGHLKRLFSELLDCSWFKHGWIEW